MDVVFFDKGFELSIINFIAQSLHHYRSNMNVMSSVISTFVRVVHLLLYGSISITRTNL